MRCGEGAVLLFAAIDLLLGAMFMAGWRMIGLIGRDRFIGLWDGQGWCCAFAEDLSQGTAATTVSRVKGRRSSREKACSQALAAEEGIGRGSCAFRRRDIPRAEKR